MKVSSSKSWLEGGVAGGRSGWRGEWQKGGVAGGRSGWWRNSKTPLMESISQDLVNGSHYAGNDHLKFPHPEC